MSMKVEANPSAAGGAGVTSVNGDSGPAVTLTTDNINEGGSNLYYTNTRADNRIAAAVINDLSNVSAAAPNNNEVLKYNSTSGNWESSADSSGVTSVNGDSGPAVTLTTDNITEGSNLYYTDTRFDTRLAAKTTDNLTEGASNLYFTNTRADNRIAAADLNDLSDVSYTAGAGIDGQFLKYVNANNRWEAAAVAGSSDTLDDVVSRGATTATAIQTGGLTVTGDIDPNADLTYSIGDESSRFISYYGDVNGALRFKAKNDSGVQLNKGEVVYIKGVSGTVPTVDKARANSASTMPAFGLVYANANDQAEVQIITFGNLNDFNTSTFTAGDTVFVSSATAGALVNTAPAGESNLIQNIGRVVRSDASAGIIKVGGSGRSNATPNLDQDKIFLGNASNQAVSTALSAVNLSSFNNDLTTDNLTEGVSNFYYTDTRFDTRLAAKTTDNLTEGASNLYFTNTRADNRIAAADLNDLNDVSYTAGAGIDGQFLKYVDANNRWEAAAVSGGGGSVPTTTSVSQGTDYTITTSSGIEEIFFITPTADINVNLPAAATAGDGYKYNIKNLASGFTLTIDPNGTEKIDVTSSTFALSTQYQSITLVSDGSNWFII